MILSSYRPLALISLVLGIFLTACGGGGADTTPRAPISSLKVMGDSLADVGTFGFKFTVQGNDIYPERALALADDTGATYPSLVDVGGEIFATDVFAFARRGLPGFVFVDEQGKVVGSASGEIDSVDEVVDLVDEHLGITL